MTTIVLYHAPCWDGLVAAWSLGPDPQAAGFHVAVADGLAVMG